MRFKISNFDASTILIVEIKISLFSIQSPDRILKFLLNFLFYSEKTIKNKKKSMHRRYKPGRITGRISIPVVGSKTEIEGRFREEIKER